MCRDGEAFPAANRRAVGDEWVGSSVVSADDLAVGDRTQGDVAIARVELVERLPWADRGAIRNKRIRAGVVGAHVVAVRLGLEADVAVAGVDYFERLPSPGRCAVGDQFGRVCQVEVG